MKTLWGVTAIAVVLSAGAEARADQKHFEELAQDATPVATGDQLGSLFWSQLVDCAGIDDDLQKRQCQGIRAARKARVTGGTYVVEGDASSFEVLGFDGDKNELKLQLTACIACDEPVEVAGQRFYVVADKGDLAADDGSIDAGGLYQAARAFKNEAWAQRWREQVVPRLRTEFLVRIPARPKGWKKGGVAAYRVEVQGYRVYDPCDGTILHADPPSNPPPANRAACGDAVPSRTGEDEAEAEKDEANEPDEPAEQIPARLTVNMISTAMAPARRAARQCYITYGVRGRASFRITIDANGRVVATSQKGDFVDTPTGECLEKAVKAVTFPQTRKARTTIDYPFMLR